LFFPFPFPFPTANPHPFPGRSGAPLHYHTDAINVAVWGTKRWYLTHPAETEFHTMPAAAWVAAVLPRLPPERRPFECVQGGGDIIFVPRNWGHAVLNEETSVGYAREFRSALLLDLL
jgi:oxalate decarboxylase/phosphoglucose isomerase-like protein (cupin superfamily)